MPTRLPRGRGALLAASLLSLAACVGCGAVHTSTALGPARKLVIALDAQPSALFAPIYEAQANGDFRRGALAVTVQTPSNPLTALATKQASVAIVSEPTLLAARDAGGQLVAIGALVTGPLASIISLSSEPISSATDLVGRTLATTGTPLAKAELSTILSNADVDPAQVKVITPSGSLNSVLLSHKAQATLGGFWNFDAVQLTLAHHHPTVIHVDQAGVPSFSELVIVVRLDEAHYDGPLLRAFLQSLTRGETATLADPTGVASLLAGINRHLSKSFELAALKATAAATPATSANAPYGYQSPQSWLTFGNWMYAHDLLHRDNEGGLAITNEFLPGQGE